jgi:hypothetical protein
MKKKTYLQPATEVTGVLPIQFMDATRGWAKDGNPPFTVEKEDGVNENNPIWGDDGYGDFLDLD